jgi:hypothetical protein
MNALIAMQMIHIVGLGFVLLSTVPMVKAIAQQYSRVVRRYALFSDRDGRATDESNKAFSDKLQRWTIVVISIFGATCAAIVAISGERSNTVKEVAMVPWLQFGAWVSTRLEGNLSSNVGNSL